MALARSQRQPRPSCLLWSSCGASPRPKAALPGPVVPVVFRGRSGPGHGNAQEGEGGGRGVVGRRAAPKGLYELLGVQSHATQAQIKTAYYKQSFLFHPDRNAGSEEAAAERFIHITAAYQVLSNLSLRKKYDRGLLTQEDISTAKKPSSKTRPAAQTVAKKSQSFTFGRPLGKPVFNFDEFYRAHYGEQLERERLMRLKQKELQKRRMAMKEEKHKLFDSFVLLLFLSGVIILVRFQ